MNAPNVRWGFTQIELLVVLTIIGLLAALLFPVFLRVRENARQTTCVSNLHQIGLAIQLYQADYEGVLPKEFGDDRSIPPATQAELNAQGLGAESLDDLLPYEHDPDIYHCLDRSNPIPDAPYLRRDYDYLVPGLRQFQESHGQTKATLKPAPSSVLVKDYNHRDMSIVLRADGSVSRVQSANVVEWYYTPNGKWTQTFAPGDSPIDVFPNEPWPPQFEKQEASQ